MALQLPSIQYLQGYASNPDIVGRFKQGYDLTQGIANEAEARDALGKYVESLYLGGQGQQPQPQGIPAQLIPASVDAATNTAPWMANALENSDYLANLRNAESGGNDAAKNPKSSATGRYQITDATWQGLMQSNPELGLTADGRLDPAQQERAVRALTAQNASALKAKGIGVNPGTLYAAHFLGAPQASSVLGYADNTPMVSALPPEVIQANPHLQGMTVGDFKQWAAQNGGRPSGGYQAPMELGLGQGPQAGSAGPANGLPPREVMQALFRNPLTRQFAVELATGKASLEGAPANVREWEYFSRLSPEEQAQYITMKRANPYLDVGTGFVQPNPVAPGQPNGPAILKDNFGESYDKASGGEAGRSDSAARAGAPAAIASAQNSLDQIDAVINDPNLHLAVGLGGILPAVPNTPQAGTVARIEQLQGAAFLQAFESLKGGGQITEVEGKKATDAIARLSRVQNKEDFVQALQDLRSVVEAGLNRARAKAGQDIDAILNEYNL